VDIADLPGVARIALGEAALGEEKDAKRQAELFGVAVVEFELRRDSDVSALSLSRPASVSRARLVLPALDRITRNPRFPMHS
jgi:hypothetical protein